MKFSDKIRNETTFHQIENNVINKSFIILGSGASLNYYPIDDRNIFNDFTVIGINMIWKHFKCDYVVLQHHDLLDSIVDHTPERFNYTDFFVSRFHRGVIEVLDVLINSTYEKEFTIFDHFNQTFLNDLDFTAQDHPDKLVIGGTTAIAAISLAVKLGAKNIFLCGIDGGALDGETNLKGYFQAENPGNKDVQRNHSIRTNKLIMDFRDYLKTRNVNMFSINPFVNMSFEGHHLK